MQQFYNFCATLVGLSKRQTENLTQLWNFWSSEVNQRRKKKGLSQSSGISGHRRLTLGHKKCLKMCNLNFIVNSRLQSLKAFIAVPVCLWMSGFFSVFFLPKVFPIQVCLKVKMDNNYFFFFTFSLSIGQQGSSVITYYHKL